MHLRDSGALPLLPIDHCHLGFIAGPAGRLRKVQGLTRNVMAEWPIGTVWAGEPARLQVVMPKRALLEELSCSM